MDDNISRASMLLGKAKGDFHAACCLAKNTESSPWTVGFHAQQTVEKALKSVLQLAGIGYPFSHDLEILLKIVEQANISEPPHSTNLPYLTPFASWQRYESNNESEEPPLGIEKILEWSQSTLNWAIAIVER